MKITFLNHASFVLEDKNFKLCCDPYLFGSAFNNGWNLLKEENHEKQLKNLTHIFYSHEHPDHFSIPFLKSINSEDRSNITIIYQETLDRRVKKFCEGIGYNFLELKDKLSIKLNKDISITCGKVPFYDSWINFKIKDLNILNVNDCMLENPNLINEIHQTLNRKIDILFTQFSYASYAPTKDSRLQLAKNQFEALKKQDKLIKPKFTVPFASFIYYSNVENKFMNDSINSVMSVNDFMIKNLKSRVTILRPNQEWDGISEIDNKESLEYWKSIYENLDNLKYNSDISSIDEFELVEKSKNYIKKLKEKNNFLIVRFLRLIGLFKDIKIFIEDKNKLFKFNIFSGLEKIESVNDKKNLISLHSNSLAFIFDFTFGFDTLIVNGRLTTNSANFQSFKETFFLGTLNNTGRYLQLSKVYKYLDVKFIIRCLETLGLKKRKNPTS